MNFYSPGHVQFLRSLIKYDVEFILIGGYAAIYYGVNRNAGDLNILIAPDPANGNKLMSALKTTGLQVPDIEPSEFDTDTVDIINFTPGSNIPSAYQQSHDIELSDIRLKIIDIHDLTRNKESLKREGEKSHLDQYMTPKY